MKVLISKCLLNAVALHSFVLPGVQAATPAAANEIKPQQSLQVAKEIPSSEEYLLSNVPLEDTPFLQTGTAGPSLAHCSFSSVRHDHWMPNGQMFVALKQGGVELTTDQIDKLNALHTQFMQQSLPIFVELQNLQRQQMDMLSADNVDRDAIKELGAQMTLEKMKIGGIMSDHLADVAQLLTAEQRKKLRLSLNLSEINQAQIGQRN